MQAVGKQDEPIAIPKYIYLFTTFTLGWSTDHRFGQTRYRPFLETRKNDSDDKTAVEDKKDDGDDSFSKLMKPTPGPVAPPVKARGGHVSPLVLQEQCQSLRSPLRPRSQLIVSGSTFERSSVS
jgi:hypothetical protein